ncbi:FeoA domain-containing protein [Thermococcus sp. Bubb.Bath]|uniref:metal-dependent transcriptional regulator n=1 Tax=Thermococcus sp. Bubb.Bath TaxID=1638242 RepID=UPI0014399462|nr:FeoA domain-containing protein [Thermococcus sp. Bubb.Bath]NJF24625.1 hypothetical protein [Thermococcus sp. Bubb.Bath]
MPEWKRLLIEDILRLAKEKGEPPKVRDVMEDSKVGEEDVKSAVKEMEELGLANFRDGQILLTDKGEKTAEVIYNYHKTVERLFGHGTAHVFEHMGDRVSYLQRAESARPLEELPEGEEHVLVSMNVENPKVIARLLGVGLSPGSVFRIIRKRKDAIILEVNGRLVIIDGELSKRLFGVRRDEGTASRPA